MSERIAGMLAQFRTAAEERADAARIDIAELEAQLERARQELATEEAELAQLAAHETLQAGTAREIAPGDVQSAEGILGMLIGTLAVAPPDHATVEQLAAYANAMRALTEQANHQAVIATTRMHVLERETAAAVGALVATGQQDTQPWQPVPAVADPLAPLPPNVVDARTNPDPFWSGVCQRGDHHLCQDHQPGMVDGCMCPLHIYGRFMVNREAATWVDGPVTWDLKLTYADCERKTWRWSGGVEQFDHGQEPLMSREDRTHVDVPIGVLLAQWGPLNPVEPSPPALSEACAAAPSAAEHDCPGCGCGCHVFTVPADPEDQDEEVARCS